MAPALRSTTFNPSKWYQDFETLQAVVDGCGSPLRDRRLSVELSRSIKRYTSPRCGHSPYSGIWVKPSGLGWRSVRWLARNRPKQERAELRAFDAGYTEDVDAVNPGVPKAALHSAKVVHMCRYRGYVSAQVLSSLGTNGTLAARRVAVLANLRYGMLYLSEIVERARS